MAFKDYRDLIRQMERDMQQMTDEAFRGVFVGGGRFWQPAVDVHETDSAVVVKMELAGARADDLNVSLSSDDRVLTVSGSRTEARTDRDGRMRCHQLEIYFGPFERSVPLPLGTPVDRDKITASYRDGFMVVTLPKQIKREPRETRVIPITNDKVSTNSNRQESEGED